LNEHRKNNNVEEEEGSQDKAETVRPAGKNVFNVRDQTYRYQARNDHTDVSLHNKPHQDSI